MEYGSFIFLDVQWFATVLDPLFSHKRDSMGRIDLGGIRVTRNVASLDRLDKEHVFEPQLAEELWGAELAPHLLLALNSAGLTFPLPKDPNGGLVILSRMDAKRPPDYSDKVKEVDQTRKHDLKLLVECSFSLGLPPGFVERLLARCCRLGFPYPFWRYGALIVGGGAEEGLFSLSLEYCEKKKILTVEVDGGCIEVHAWAALSKVLSVTIKMLSEFPGLPCQPTFFCPLHKTKGMAIKTDVSARFRCAKNVFGSFDDPRSILNKVTFYVGQSARWYQSCREVSYLSTIFLYCFFRSGCAPHTRISTPCKLRTLFTPPARALILAMYWLMLAGTA